MNKIKTIAFTLFLMILGISINIYAVIPDTVKLEEVTVSANRLANFTTGAKVQDLGMLMKNEYSTETLSSILTTSSQVAIKSYGLRGMSNVSMRGMGSKHTAVLWNGFNLQSTMNGGFDMAGISSFMVDDVHIQYGGAGALFGSGAVGGVIHLNNKLYFNKGLDVQLTSRLASFNNKTNGIKLGLSKEKFAVKVAYLQESGDNDFEFVNTQQFGDPKMKLENAGYNSKAATLATLFRINSRQRLITNLWYQEYYHENPPMMTNDTAAAYEDVQSMRFSAEWQRREDISSQYLRFYFGDNSMIYHDPLLPAMNNLDSTGLINHLDNYSYILAFENKTSIGDNFLLNIGLNEAYESAHSYNYAYPKYRNRLGLFSSLKYFNTPKTFAAVLSFREELVDTEFTPFTMSLGGRYQINEWLNLNSNLSKTYNLPTFNDLYWVPGGNPNLKAEDGWSGDLGANILIKRRFVSYRTSLTGFYNDMKNMVIWTPGDQGFWAAENVEKVKSKGLESDFNFNLRVSDFKLDCGIAYTYTKATNEKTDIGDEATFGKQLPYIAKHKGGVNVNIAYRWFYVRYNHTYTGKRFITKSNQEYVDPYDVADISIGAKLNLRDNQLNMNFKIHNVGNETYQVMAFYAMPLQNYSFSLTYNFNKIKSKNNN